MLWTHVLPQQLERQILSRAQSLSLAHCGPAQGPETALISTQEFPPPGFPKHTQTDPEPPQKAVAGLLPQEKGLLHLGTLGVQTPLEQKSLGPHFYDVGVSWVSLWRCMLGDGSRERWQLG